MRIATSLGLALSKTAIIMETVIVPVEIASKTLQTMMPAREELGWLQYIISPVDRTMKITPPAVTALYRPV